MDLNKEITGVKPSFKEGGILTKIFSLLSFFISLSSLTSISSYVIEWKGVILDAINFYQYYYVGSISSISSIIGLSYSEMEIHVATVCSISITVGMRILATNQKAVFRAINNKYGSALEPKMTSYWVISIVTPIAIWSVYGLTDSEIQLWLVATITLVYPVFLVAPKLVMSKNGEDNFEDNYTNYFKRYYAYFASFIIIIGVLAAINTGLQEKEPNNSSKRDALTGVPSCSVEAVEKLSNHLEFVKISHLKFGIFDGQF